MRKSVKVYLWALVVSILPTIALFAYMLMDSQHNFYFHHLKHNL